MNSGRVVIGMAADIESLNPLYAFNVNEGNIAELLYLNLFHHRWNDSDGDIYTEPMLAERWEWSEDSSSIMIFMRDDVYWSDGEQVTSDDVIFSFDIYSDPDVQSKLYGTFISFYTKEDLRVDPEKTFNKISSSQLKINFLPGSSPSLFNLDFAILPRHIFEKINRESFVSESAGIKPVTNGAYRFERWDKEQSIVLRVNEQSYLTNSESIPEIIFKVVPDYTSRITQIKRGEIDFVEDIKPDDVGGLKKNAHLVIAPLKGREYEYIGWNNIDSEMYHKNGDIKPHRLFGSSSVRKALTYAINRKEILEEYLFNNGEMATGPVAPIFKNAVHPNLEPYPFDPDKAKKILSSEGWIDKDRDGILEKNNIEFSFTLYIPGGNPRRNYTATMIKNNLKAVGINVNIATLEMGIFIDEMFGKKMDAWLASWFVAIPVELKPFWYSDLEVTPLNTASYRNNRIDYYLTELEGKISETRKNEVYRAFQEVIYDDQPVSFLYWIDNMTAYNKRIKNVNVDPLGFIHHCWEWSIE
ncbi:MAG: ABC transporter substrate-binding protein [Ignavibacteriaceae bacterium]